MAETATFPSRLVTPLRPVGSEARHSPAPWIAFGITLLMTFVASALIAFAVDGRDSARFENATRSTVSEVRVRLETYVAVLRGADGFFAASENVDHDEFREYAGHLGVQRHYPGVQGIGFARRMQPRELRDLVEDMRAQGLPFFEVHPLEPARPDFFPIVYLEPQDRRNRAALGFDMFADSVRREAMERARDKGVAAMSGVVRLVQELDEPDPQPGFLIYHPVYRDGRVPATVEERRRLLAGFIYAPFRARDLFDAIVPNDRRNQLAFRVRDGPNATSGLLYDSERITARREAQPSYRATDTLTIAGRTWTAAFETLPAFDLSSGQPLVPLIAVVGVLVSFVLFRVMRSQVLARARAERIEATRGRFFAAMSHELRTPINAILGYNDLLLSGVYGDLPPAQAHGVERSQKAARHLAELVNDVLDLSKIEAGKVRLDFETIRVGEVIEDLLTTIRPVAEERGCTLNVMPCECEGRILTDPRRVRQILLNLLSNATKFGAGQPIGVRCADVDHDGGVLVEVTDRGPGIAPDDMDRIFEEFVQLERGTQEGTGLGLAISRRLAVLLGGHLDVESLPGKGSTFRLHLPAHPPRTTG